MDRTETQRAHSGPFTMIFSDIDGTVLNTAHQVLPRTKAKIQELTRKGIPFILVSARSPSGVWKVLDELDIQAPIVCYSGAMVYDAQRKPVLSIPLERAVLLPLYEDIGRSFPEIVCSVYAADGWYGADTSCPEMRLEETITALQAKQCAFPAGFNELPEVHKLLCMGPPESIENLEAQIHTAYPGLRCYRSKDTYLEIMSPQASKSGAMSFICAQRNQGAEQVVAFGDHYNDVDLLQAAGLGVAMGNAPQEVQKQADRVTDDCDHEGIYLILEEFFA